MSMSTESSPKCPQCGAPLPEHAPAGLCPNCLMGLNLKTETVFTDDSPATHPPLPPEQIAPHFPQLEILECLGRGGMGVVYKARQKSLNRLVALKLLAPERVRDARFADRFAREAQALAALNHPNIVTIYDFGQAGGFYFLLMEFVDGLNLRQLLRTRKFTPEEALAIVPPLCDALQFAHDRGIVHRDIKPENLLLGKTGQVKVADFGIAKMLGTINGVGQAGAAATAENATQNAVGTPSYSAPEQKTDPQRVDSRADIYSLGVVFYEMLTGELPGKKIEAPSKKVQIDVRLDEIVLRALETKPELRYQQVSDVKTMVETIVGTPPNPPPPFGRTSRMGQGIDYRSKATLFGLPWLHVTSGCNPQTKRVRVAKGIIAIGGVAQGVIAFGGVAMGGFAFGGLAIGVFAFGGCALGLVSFGGLALALIAALGGGAMAPIALGGGAIGYFAFGGGCLGVHVLDSTTRDPVAQQFFLQWAKKLMANIQWLNAVLIVLVVGIGVGVPLWIKRRTDGSTGEGAPGRRAFPTLSSFLIGLVVFAMVTGIAFVYANVLPTTYAATARVKLDQVIPSSQISNGYPHYAVESYDPYAIQTEFEIIRSEKVLSNVISRLNLNEVWGKKYFNGRILNSAETLKILESCLDLRPIRNTSLISITCYGQSATECASLANAIAESFRDYNADLVRADVNSSKPVGKPAMSSDDGLYRIQIIDRAETPRRPVKPNKPLIIVCGAMVGIFLGLTVFVLRLIWHFFRLKSFEKAAVRPVSDEKQKPDHFWRWFAVVVLAMIAIPIAISILGLLAAIAIPNFVQARQRSLENAQRSALVTDAQNAFSNSDISRWPTNLSFGPVIERVLSLNDNGITDLLDLDSGKVVSLREMKLNLDSNFPLFLPTNGLAIIQPAAQGPFKVTGRDMLVACQPELDWKQVSPQELLNCYANVPLDYIKSASDSSPGSGALPNTFSFKTGSGKVGLLQITALTDNPRGVKIRYKVMDSVIPSTPVNQPPVATPNLSSDPVIPRWPVNPQFVARVNQGSVQLVGIRNQSPTNAVGWLANGTVPDEPFFPGSPLTEYVPGGESNLVGKRAVFWVHSETTNGPVSSARYYFNQESGIVMEGLTTMSDGPHSRHTTFYLDFLCATNSKTADMSFGVANGPWKVACILDHRDNFLGRVVSQAPGMVASYNSVYGDHGEVAVNCNYSKSKDRETRMVGVDDEGQATVVSENAAQISNDQTGGILLMSSNAFTHLKEFQLQWRPYQWVEFHNVSLEPGYATKVEVKDADAMK